MIFLNACKNGQKGVVEAFIKKGGLDFNKRDSLGNTALFDLIHLFGDCRNILHH